MEWIDTILAALTVGAHAVLSTGAATALVWVGYAVTMFGVRGVPGLPAWLRPIVMGWIERQLMPIAENAVRYAEEWAQRKIDAGVAAAGTLGVEKVRRAKLYLLSRTWTDRFLTDARLSEILDAALVRVGLGAAGAIRIGAEILEQRIEDLPAPPATPTA